MMLCVMSHPNILFQQGHIKQPKCGFIPAFNTLSWVDTVWHMCANCVGLPAISQYLIVSNIHPCGLCVLLWEFHPSVSYSVHLILYLLTFYPSVGPVIHPYIQPQIALENQSSFSSAGRLYIYMVLGQTNRKTFVVVIQSYFIISLLKE